MRVTVRLGIGAILLFWIFHSIFLKEGRQYVIAQGTNWASLTVWEQWRTAWFHGPAALWDTLNQVDLIPFLASLVLMGMTILLGIWRWRVLLHVQRIELPVTRAAEISLVAHFFNSFLLGSTGGDLLKAYYAARETRTKKTEAVITVVVDRLIGLFSMLLFACVMMFPNFAWVTSDRRLITFAALVWGLMAACGLVIGLSLWGRIATVWPRLWAWARRLPKGEILERSLEACQRFGPERRFLLKAMTLSMLVNLVCVLQILALAWGLALQVPATALLVVVPIVICLSAIPITPNGLGVRENLYVWMLTMPAFGVDSTQALSLSLLAYAGSLFWSLVGGVVYVTLKESQHLSDLTETSEAAEQA